MSTFWTGKILDAVGDATERVTGDNHVDSAVDAVQEAADSGADKARLAAEFIRDGALLRRATQSISENSTMTARQTTRAAVHAAAHASFVKELAKICGKAGTAGAVVDGAVGGLRATRHLRAGTIDGRQALRHVGAEAGCGFVTSASGTAGTLAVFMVTGSMGPAALAAGMGASMGSRWAYRQVVPETLPDEDEIERMKNQAAREAREHSESAAPSEDDGPEQADAGSTPPGTDGGLSSGPSHSPPDREDYGDGPSLEDIGPADSEDEDDQNTGGPDLEDRSDGDSDGDDDFFEDIGPDA